MSAPSIFSKKKTHKEVDEGEDEDERSDAIEGIDRIDCTFITGANNQITDWMSCRRIRQYIGFGRKYCKEVGIYAKYQVESIF